jgi:hypothetical protein
MVMLMTSWLVLWVENKNKNICWSPVPDKWIRRATANLWMVLKELERPGRHRFLGFNEYYLLVDNNPRGATLPETQETCLSLNFWVQGVGSLESRVHLKISFKSEEEGYLCILAGSGMAKISRTAERATGRSRSRALHWPFSICAVCHQETVNTTPWCHCQPPSYILKFHSH